MINLCRTALAWACAFAIVFPSLALGAEIAQVVPRTAPYAVSAPICLRGDFAGLAIGRSFDPSQIDVIAENVGRSNGARVITFRPKLGAESGVQYRAVVEPRAEKVVMLQFTIWLADSGLIDAQMELLMQTYSSAGFPSEREGAFHRHEKGAHVIVSAQKGPRGIQIACHSDSFDWLAPQASGG